MSKNKLKIAVISGGLSNERDVSIKTGQQIFHNLSDEKYDKFFIEISKDGKWLLSDDNLKLRTKYITKSLVIMHPDKGIVENDLNNYDVVFLALHGKFGEDGKIQSLLDILGVPYTGSGVLASAIGMNKIKTIEFIRGLKIKIPNFLSLFNKNNIDLLEIDRQIKKNIKYPCIVKPNESGSSIGVSIVQSFKDLKIAIDVAYNKDEQILIQEFILGREITCGVLGNSHRTKLEVLPPIEVIAKNTFFDYNAKYFSKETQEICPAKISKEHIDRIMLLAKKIHERLGCDGLTRSDFILRDNEFYFLEINTLPGLTEQSLCPKEAKVAGMTFSEFLNKQIQLATVPFH